MMLPKRRRYVRDHALRILRDVYHNNLLPSKAIGKIESLLEDRRIGEERRVNQNNRRVEKYRRH